MRPFEKRAQTEAGRGERSGARALFRTWQTAERRTFVLSLTRRSGRLLTTSLAGIFPAYPPHPCNALISSQSKQLYISPRKRHHCPIASFLQPGVSCVLGPSNPRANRCNRSPKSAGREVRGKALRPRLEKVS